MSDRKRPSFRVRQEPTGFDVYRQDRFAEIIVRLRQDYADEISDPDEVRLYLDAYVDDGELTEEQANDIYLIVIGGLEVPVIEHGMPDELFIIDGLIGGITKYIIENSHRPQDEMALLMAIQVVGIVLARRLVSETGDTPNLYQIVTGPSGSGKDAARQMAILLLTHACGSHLLGPESVTSAASIISLASQCPAILFLIDEVGKIISAIKSRNAGNTEREIETLLLKLWSSALNRKFRHKGYADIENNIELCRPNISFYGTATPASLYGNGSLDLTSIVDGFLSRCIIFDASDKVPPLRDVMRQEPPEDVIAKLREWIDFEPGGEMGWIADPQEKIATFSDEACNAFKAAVVRWDLQAERLPEEHGAAVYRRCPEKARKLALIYAGSEHGPEDEIIIEKRHADWAIALVSWLTDRSLNTIRTKVAASARERDMALISDFIEKKTTKGATLSDISNRFRNFGRKQRDELIADLIEAGEVIVEERQTGGRIKRILFRKEWGANKAFSSNKEVAL